MSQRAIDILNEVELIAAEDTRHSKKLLSHYDIRTPITAYHAHNESQQTEKLLKQLQHGSSVAIISDAGTPLISDPGATIVIAAIAAGITVTPIPGPCAITTALAGSGLACDQFYFYGFLPVKSGPRREKLTELLNLSCTVVLYEAPHRIIELLKMLATTVPDREICVAKELTKQYERFVRGSVDSVLQRFIHEPDLARGEFVVLIEGEQPTPQREDFEDVLIPLLAELPLKQAVKLTSEITQMSKNDIYQRALLLQKQRNS